MATTASADAEAAGCPPAAAYQTTSHDGRTAREGTGGTMPRRMGRRRRLPRLLLSLWTLLLLLSVVAIVMWIRSYRHRDVVRWFDGRTAYQIVSQYSTLGFFATPQPPTAFSRGWHHEHGESQYPDAGDMWGRFSFERDFGLEILLPYWIVCLVTLAPFACGFLLSRVCRRRTDSGESLCPA